MDFKSQTGYLKLNKEETIMKRIIALTISLSLLCSCLNAFSGFAASDVIGTITGADYDSYFEDGRDETGFKDNEVMLAGSVYNRKAFLRFDISEYADSGFVGCVLNLTMRNITEGNTISIRACDPKTKKDGMVISEATISEIGKVTQGFNVSSYVKSMAQTGSTEVAFTVSSNADSTTVFSSQASKEADRPSLTFTRSAPYVKGQIEMKLPEYSKEQFELMLQDTIKKGHPYLFATKDMFERVRQNAFGQDEIMTKAYADVKAIATSYLNKKPQPIDPATSYISRGVEGSWTIVPYCAFVYLIEGDEAYAKRAWQEAEYFLSIENWGTYQFLDNSQAALIVAICYDWLYDWLTPDRRDQLVTNLREKHLNEMHDYLLEPGSSKFHWRYSHVTSDTNHGVLNNSSTFIQALAIADRDPAFCAETMSYAMHYMNVPLYRFYPDSMWPEGVGYWGFVGPMSLRAIMSMQSAFGSTLGYENCETFMNCAYHPIYLTGDSGTFVFNDEYYYNPKNVVYDKFIFGVIGNNISLQKYSLENDELNHPFFCLWYDPAVDYSAYGDIELDKDKLFRNVDMAVFRNTWDSDQYMMGGMFVQDIGSTSHAHMNSGSLSFHALGEMWITNCGKDNYSLPGYSGAHRFDYYCQRAEGSNAIVINPSADGGQTVMAGDIIDEFVSKERGGYAISDLTGTYEKYGAASYKRGVMMGNDRTNFIIQDELKLKTECEVYSFINFHKSDIKISEDGKSATITNGDKKLDVQIICDEEYEISIMDSKPLPTSPDMPGQSDFKDIKKIAFRFPKTDGYNMSIVVTPYLTDEELKAIPEATFIPLSVWSIPEGEYVKKPALTDLTVNGKTIDGFGGENRHYEIITEDKEADIKAVAPAGYTAEVKKEDTLYTIYLKSGSDLVNTYMVRLTEPEKLPELPVKDLTGYTQIAISEATASDDDGNVPEGAIDGDPSTRWSASGEQTITLKLARSANVATIGIAFFNGHKRSTYFDIQISTDGKVWKTVSQDLAACGFSEEMEYFDIKPTTASHIRLVCHGNSVNAWNSISEVNVYAK